jgi:hypothetical protein
MATVMINDSTEDNIQHRDGDKGKFLIDWIVSIRVVKGAARSRGPRHIKGLKWAGPLRPKAQPT